jgi:hypothetical protein
VAAGDVLLAPLDLDVRVLPSFGTETLPDGLVAIVGVAA